MSEAANHLARDHALEALIDLVSGPDGWGGRNVGITVIVQGTMVAGNLVSPGAWSEITEMGVDAHDDFGRSVHAVFSGAVSGSIVKAESRHAFVHLSDAVLATGSRQLSTLAWRCRTVEIGGWFLGRTTGDRH